MKRAENGARVELARAQRERRHLVDETHPELLPADGGRLLHRRARIVQQGDAQEIRERRFLVLGHREVHAEVDVEADGDLLADIGRLLVCDRVDEDVVRRCSGDLEALRHPVLVDVLRGLKRIGWRKCRQRDRWRRACPAVDRHRDGVSAHARPVNHRRRGGDRERARVAGRDHPRERHARTRRLHAVDDAHRRSRADRRPCHAQSRRRLERRRRDRSERFVARDHHLDFERLTRARVIVRCTGRHLHRRLRERTAGDDSDRKDARQEADDERHEA